MHISVLLIAYFGLPWTVDEMELEAPIIEVELVEVTDETNLPPKETEQELEEKPETPAPPEKQAAPPPPPPPPPEPEPVSVPEPEPAPAPKPLKMAALPEPEPLPEPAKPEPEEEKPEVKQEEPKPAPKPVPRPIAKPKPPPVPKTPPTKQPEKKKSTFDPSRIAALLDKKKDEGPQRRAPKKVPVFKQPEIKASTTAPKSAFVARLTISDVDHLRRQIERCWTVPAGARNAEDLVVKIRITLNPDGSLGGQPQIVDRERLHKPGQEFYRTAAESALRAVLQCEPYSMPREKYERWRDIILTFNPKHMLDG